MHMISKKDLNKAELETMRITKNPTTVMTANGEVQTNKEATVNVKEMNLFVKLSMGKLCEEHGYTYHCKSGQKRSEPTSHQTWQEN